MTRVRTQIDDGIDEAAALRIRESLGVYGAEVDLQKIKSELDQCLFLYRVHAFAPKKTKKKIRALEKLISTGKNFLHELKTQRSILEKSTSAYPLKAVEQILNDLNEEARGLKNAFSGVGAGGLFRPRSEFDVLVGGYLTQSFTRLTGKRARFSRKNGMEPTGPLIDFINQTLKELEILGSNGQEYKLESIAKAIQNERMKS
jgi:hypothetical protein